MIFALDGTEVLVAAISTIGLILVAVLTNEGRKARQTLGTKGPGDPTFMELMIGLYAEVQQVKRSNEAQEGRLTEIEGEVNYLGGRVHKIEDHLGMESVVTKLAREGHIERREGAS